MLYYPCLEVEPGGLDDSRNTCTTVEPLDETRRWAVLTRRVWSLDPKEPRRRRPVLGGLPLTGRSVQILCPVNGRVVYQNQIRQDPRKLTLAHSVKQCKPVEYFTTPAIIKKGLLTLLPHPLSTKKHNP